MNTLEAIERLLDGIDRTECDDIPGGWWETSAGEDMGKKVLKQIRALFPLRNWDISFVNGDGVRKTFPRQAHEIAKVNDRQLEIDGQLFTIEEDSITIGEVKLSSRQPHPDYESALSAVQSKSEEPIPFSSEEMKGWVRRA